MIICRISFLKISKCLTAVERRRVSVQYINHFQSVAFSCVFRARHRKHSGDKVDLRIDNHQRPTAIVDMLSLFSHKKLTHQQPFQLFRSQINLTQSTLVIKSDNATEIEISRVFQNQNISFAQSLLMFVMCIINCYILIKQPTAINTINFFWILDFFF